MRGLTTQPLVELVTNPRELGYEQAAARRGPNPPRRWYDRPAVVAGALVAGFVLAVAYVHTHRAAPEAAKVHDSLVNRVRTLQRTDDTLQQRLDGLTAQLGALRASALPSSGALAQQLQRAEVLSGQVAVTGPGLTVTLSEPPAPSPTGVPGRNGSVPITATHILTDRDLRSVVNELWSDGAEAIAVNGIRLTPTSAIRFAGQAVLVDLEPISPPYRIAAIGDPNTLVTAFAASEVASRYNTLESAEGIGFSFAEKSRLTMSANAPAALRYAHVSPPPSPRPSPSGTSR
jgi:uncharacterized protein YlxW (UPF0749 family)